MWLQVRDDTVDGLPGRHHDENPPRPFEHRHQARRAVGGGHRLAFRRTVDKRLRLGRVEIVADDWKTAALDVAREVRPHHAEADHAHCVFHDDIPGASGGFPTRNRELASARHLVRAALDVGRPLGEIDIGRVRILEAEVLALLARNTRRERDGDPRRFDVTVDVVGARSLYVRRVRQDPQRVAPEAIPLSEEIVAAVIPDLIDHVPVNVAGLTHVRRVDDDLAAVGHRGLGLVNALGCRPQVLIHGRHDGQHAIEGLVEPDDMTPGGERRRLPPRVVVASRVAAEDTRDALVGHDDREQRQGSLQQVSGAVDDRAHRRIDRPEYVRARDERAQPMREVDDFRCRDAGKQVLRAARKADHLVREDGPADKDVVVFDDEAIERDRDGLIQPSEAELLDRGRRNRPERRKGRRVIPTVIENPSIAGAAVDNRPSDQPAQLLVAHRRVRAECDEKIEGRHARAELALEDVEHQRHRHRAGAIRDEDDHPLTVDRQSLQSLPRQVSDFLRRQIPLDDATSDDDAHVRNCSTRRRLRTS